MFSEHPLKIDIEYDGLWYDWNVRYKDRHLCGCARNLDDALAHVQEASANIVKTRLNPPRNP